MNWRRGLLRLWVPCAVAWVGIAFVMANPLNPLRALQNQTFIARAEVSGYGIDEITTYLLSLSVGAWIDFIALAIIPSFFVLLAICTVAWVTRGFRVN